MRLKLYAQILLAASALSVSGPQLSAAQITVSALDEAKPFAPGANVSGLSVLNASAWQGTSPARAVRLLEAAPLRSSDSLVQDMLRQVALSGLVPPEGSGEDFDNARIALARAVASPSEYANFAQRNAALANDPVRRANDRLARGDLAAACELSDQLTTGRGESYWVRLRAACHDMRGEAAAAELARDILRDREEPVDIKLGDAPTGFWADVERLLDDPQGLSVFMRDQAAGHSSEDEPADDDALAGAQPAIPGALDLIADGEQGVAQAFFLAEQGGSDAMAFAAQAAAKAGLDPHRLITANQGFLEPGDMITADLPLFTEHAVTERDLGLLQALYRAVPPDMPATQEAIALASDALGGGFRSGPLGEGIDGRLQEGGDIGLSARRDALIAMALGASLSDAADMALEGQHVDAADPKIALALTGLNVVSQSGSRAETLLRAASILDANSKMSAADLYHYLQALRGAGFYDLAGQVAARDFLRDVKSVPLMDLEDE